MTFPEFQRADQAIANQRREKMWRERRNSQKTTVQSWGRVLATPQGIRTKTSLSCFADIETFTGWEIYVTHRHIDPRLVGTRRLMMLPPT